MVPAHNTVALRIAGLDPLKTTRIREGQDASRTLQGVGGIPPAVTLPLPLPLEQVQVQIDHTVIDLIVVDERDRQPIGRPYLTLAIDVLTRCVVGMVVTLEAPSAVSVGLCLAHAGCEQHGIRLDYRPLGQPHYGGIVERIIGTAMQMIHDELPGTTFSNPDTARAGALARIGGGHLSRLRAQWPAPTAGRALGRSYRADRCSA